MSDQALDDVVTVNTKRNAPEAGAPIMKMRLPPLYGCRKGTAGGTISDYCDPGA
jgi:hypothetical protein